MKATIIAIGDELLIGQVLDTNTQWISQQCTSLNINIINHLTIKDGVDSAVEVINRAFDECDLLILTGGLGPTNDDYTVRALAQYYGMPISFHQPTWDRLEVYFSSRGRKPEDALRQQAMLPEGITLLPNDMGTAPGMYYYRGGKHLVSFPGVPYEMKHLFLDRFIPIIQSFIGQEKLIQRTILTVGMGETSIAEKISEIESNMADGLTLAYLPDIGKVRLRISGIGEDGQLLQEKVDEVSHSIMQILGEAVYGEGDMTLSQALQELMHRKKMTLGLAESCTGGNISKHITAIPGSSRFYKGGIVSYANEIKESVLGVRRESIESFGAVSEVVAREMADGALRVLDVDIAASVTGIAGPDGGSETKPVGTFWVGLAIKGGETQAYKINFNRDRERNIEYVTVYVLNRIRLCVNDN